MNSSPEDQALEIYKSDLLFGFHLFMASWDIIASRSTRPSTQRNIDCFSHKQICQDSIMVSKSENNCLPL